jgi:hypothetical protein
MVCVGWIEGLHGIGPLALLCPLYFTVYNSCPYLYWATTDFTIGDQVLLAFGIIQHNFRGLTAERASD